MDSVLAVTAASNKGENIKCNTSSWSISDYVVVFGMGLDLAAFLSVYSGVMSGDILNFSIGGKPKSSLISGLTSSLGLLGEGQGLSNSHNRFECDASPTRTDLYSTYVSALVQQ